MSRRVYGIGETIYDIIFKGGEPQTGKPGGSTFNTLISLGRAGISNTFISEVGDDNIGSIILKFMEDNGVSTSHTTLHKDRKSSISLAFLDENSDADYSFYKDYSKQKITPIIPDFKEDDILIFGSYFSLNPVLASTITPIIEAANRAKAIVYYDPNFRSSHLNEVKELLPSIERNIKYADIVRGSDEDFKNIYNLNRDKDIYAKIGEICSNIIVTKGADGVSLSAKRAESHMQTPVIEPISTIGAGDNFNAGLAYGLIVEGVRYSDLETLDSDIWNKIISHGIAFSTDVCQSYDNYISKEFILNYK